jgi:hypothetical protein
MLHVKAARITKYIQLIYIFSANLLKNKKQTPRSFDQGNKIFLVPESWGLTALPFGQILDFQILIEN